MVDISDDDDAGGGCGGLRILLYWIFDNAGSCCIVEVAGLPFAV